MEGHLNEMTYNQLFGAFMVLSHYIGVINNDKPDMVDLFNIHREADLFSLAGPELVSGSELVPLGEEWEGVMIQNVCLCCSDVSSEYRSVADIVMDYPFKNDDIYDKYCLEYKDKLFAGFISTRRMIMDELNERGIVLRSKTSCLKDFFEYVGVYPDDLKPYLDLGLRETRLAAERNTDKYFIETSNSMGISLRNADFSNADLEGVNLCGADLRGVNFRGANLEGADIDADLNGADLSFVILTNAKLSGVSLEDIIHDGDGHKLSSVFGSNVEEYKEIIEDIARRTVSRLNVDLSNIFDGRGLNIRNADFGGVNREGMGDDCPSINERRIVIHDRDGNELYSGFGSSEKEFIEDIVRKKKSLRDADLSKMDLSGADLRGAYLIDAILDKANLQDAILQKADLSGASLVSANLRGADLRSAELHLSFRGPTVCNYADFSGANLSGLDDNHPCRANGIHLDHVCLKDANLEHIQLTAADLSYADFTGANLHSAELYDSKFDHTYFHDANLDNAKVSSWPKSVDVIDADLSGVLVGSSPHKKCPKKVEVSSEREIFKPANSAPKAKAESKPLTKHAKVKPEKKPSKSLKK